MTEYADIVIEDGDDWQCRLVIEGDAAHARIRLDEVTRGRRRPLDSDIAFDARHLDAVIDALTRIRDGRRGA